MAHLALGIPIVLHDGVALLELLCVLDNIIGIARLHVLGPALGEFSLWVLPFPGMVRDTNGKPSPGKGAENNLAVLDVHPLLKVQVESLQVTVDEVQPGLQLRESGCHGMANRKCVEPSNLSKMYSEDAMKTMNTTKMLREPFKRDGARCSPRHLVAPYHVDTCHATCTSKMLLYLSTYISL